MTQALNAKEEIVFPITQGALDYKWRLGSFMLILKMKGSDYIH